MKKLLILCLLLLGCNVPSASPPQNKGLTRLSYVNTLSLEKTRELLIICMTSRLCTSTIDEQIMYEQSLVNGGTK